MLKEIEIDRRDILKRVIADVAKAGLDAALVNSQCNVRYLSGYHTSGALLLVPRKGRLIFLIDPMNITLVEKLLAGSGIQIVEASGNKTEVLAKLIKAKNIKCLGIEEGYLSAAFFKTLRIALKGVKMPNLAGLIENVRTVKSADEIKVIRRACAMTEEIWRKVSAKIHFGMSEREVAAMIDVAIRMEGCDNSFPTIVATGPNTAYPHAVPTDRRLKKGEHLLADFGIRFSGYCSDLTRLWSEGRIMRKIELLEGHVRRVQDAAIGKIGPGARIGDLLDQANSYFEKNGLIKYVCHGLGHGIGINVHEGPFLSSRDPDDRLEKGMIVTVEPGLYVEGTGGVRVEDMVLVTDKGCEVLTI